MVPVEAVTEWRGLADYLVKFRRELDILRTLEEFSSLNSQIRLKFPFSAPDSLVLPETFWIDSLSAYANVFMTTDTLQICQLFKDMITLPMVFEARLPVFRPVPPKLQSREEVYLRDALRSDFELWSCQCG